jgi:hypothetical protein
MPNTNGTLYRIPDTGIPKEEYENNRHFAFSAYGFLFFTNLETASQFSSEIVTIHPLTQL